MARAWDGADSTAERIVPWQHQAVTSVAATSSSVACCEACGWGKSVAHAAAVIRAHGWS